MIRLENLSKSFGTKSIADDLNFQFPARERLAIVGPNGAGKTTLLNMICGIEEPDSGRVDIPKDVVIGYLPQYPNPNPEPTILAECMAGYQTLYDLKHRLEQLSHNLSEDAQALHEYEQTEAQMRALDGYALESKAASILNGLGFGSHRFEQSPRELSGGWRMRLELARIFIRPIDFIVLDEPTNHLDLPSLVWVENYLKNFPGTVLFVSHDRSLLNRLANHILHLSHGELHSYPGNFDQFLVQKEERAQQSQAQLDNLRRKRQQMESFVERFGAKASKASQAQSRVKMIERLKALEEQVDVGQQENSVSFRLPDALPSDRVLLDVHDLAIGYDHPLAEQVSLQIERGQKIAIIGANGIGKSTLLKTIVGHLPSLNGKLNTSTRTQIAYYSQDPEDLLDQNRTILDNVLQISDKIGEPAARSILGAFLFRSEDVFKPVNVLSGGEKARVALACLLLREANLLLLDEPTNHLDMTSVEVLVEAVSKYSGTCLFVSHDRDFIDAICTHVFVMLPDGRHHLFAGNLADYQRMATTIGFPNLFEMDQQAASSSKLPSEASASERKQSSQAPSPSLSQAEAKQIKSRRASLQKQAQSLETEQQSLHQKINQLESDMASCHADYSKVQELQSSLESVRLQLERNEETWLEVSSELEDLEDILRSANRL